MKNLKKLTKSELKSVNGGEPVKYCTFCEWANKVICSDIPIVQCP